jgi:hypothetical protein
MPPYDPLSAILDELRRMEFSELYPAEKILLKRYVGQEPQRTKLFESMESRDQTASKDGPSWKRDREIRSKLLRLLCTDRTIKTFADPRGIIAEGALISGRLDLAEITVPFPLSFQNCYFSESPYLYRTDVPELILAGSFAPGISARHLVVKGDLSLAAFTSKNEMIDLTDCHIGGDLIVEDATLQNPDRLDAQGKPDESSGTALQADGGVIDGYVLLRKWERQFNAEGEMRFYGAQIRGDLDCEGGHFTHPASERFPHRGIALDVERASVKGSVLLRGGFSANGKVDLDEAQMGNLICGECRFESRGYAYFDNFPVALSGERIIVVGNGDFTDKGQCTVIGGIDLVDARFGGTLYLGSSDLSSATLDLTGASVSRYSDSGKLSWPPQDHLYLRRFEYAGFVNASKDADTRLEWLSRQPADDFNTESYAQLAKVLLQDGDEDGARQVLQKMAELQSKHHSKHWFLSPRILFEGSIGYGYQPILAVWYSALLWLVGWVIYRRSYLAGSLVPTDKDAYSEFKNTGTLPSSYPRLSCLMLSAENSLPLVKLGQADKWQAEPDAPSTSPPLVGTPSAQPQPAGTGAPKFSRRQIFEPIRRLCYRTMLATGLEQGPTGRSLDTKLSRIGTSPRFVRGFIWVQILLGWLFATLFVAGVSGIIKK